MRVHVPIDAVVKLSIKHTEIVTAGLGAVWLTDGDGTLIAVDPSTNRVRSRFAGVPGVFLSTGFGSVWISDFEASMVRRVDPATGRVLAVVRTPDGPEGLVAADGYLWVANHHAASLSKIDPRTNRVVATIRRVGAGFDGGPSFLAAANRRVYVTVPNTSSVYAVDTRTRRRTRFHVDEAVTTPCGQMTLDKDFVYATGCYESPAVARIDVRTGAVTTRILPTYPGDGIVRGSLIWFASISDPTKPERGGPLVALSRYAGRLVATAAMTGAKFTAAAAYGAWWVAGTKGRLLRIDPANLPTSV